MQVLFAVKKKHLLNEHIGHKFVSVSNYVLGPYCQKCLQHPTCWATSHAICSADLLHLICHMCLAKPDDMATSLWKAPTHSTPVLGKDYSVPAVMVYLCPGVLCMECSALNQGLHGTRLWVYAFGERRYNIMYCDTWLPLISHLVLMSHLLK